MTITWKIEQIDVTDGAPSVVHWRANGDEGATAYGSVSIEGLTLDAGTTEANVIEKVKRALNAVGEQRDENGNVIPPLPGKETAATDAIEASLVAQAEAIKHPKTRPAVLPWAI